MNRMPSAPIGLQLDYEHQSAPDTHDRQAVLVTRRVWDGMELRKCKKMQEMQEEVLFVCLRTVQRARSGRKTRSSVPPAGCKCLMT